MSADARDVNSPSVVAAAALLTSVCLLPVMIIPCIIGAAAHDLSLEPRQLGFLAASEIGGVIAVMASSVLWVRRGNWRALVVLGAVVAVVGNLLAAQMHSAASLMTLLFVASCGSGIAYAPAICALSDTSYPDRNFGYSFFLQILLSGLVGFVATAYGQEWGLSGLLVLLAGFFAATLLLVPFMPRGGAKQVVASGQNAPSLSLWMGLLGMLLLNGGPMAVWAFFERIGNAAGFSEHSVGTAIAAGLLMGAPGALLSSAVGKRFGRALPLSVATLAMIATFFAAVLTRDLVCYFLCALSFQFLLNFGLAFQYGAMSTADVSGRLIVLAPTFQGLGGMAGPAVAGLLVHGNNYTPVAGVGGSSAFAGLLLILWLCRDTPQ